ncbi:MAG: maleylacetoacetate isomerase [Bdellovibrionales bacterium]|nr:maleylacetoacetate isomerase [Bdellovibrionales bacterium]
MKLYSYYRSSCSYRVRNALNHKNLTYDYAPVHLVKEGGEQFQESFKKLNPSSKVPVLEHNGNSFFQSTAIIEYLDEVFPENPLFPKEAVEKAKVRMLCEVINSDIQPLQNLRLLKSLVGEYGLNDEQKVTWIRRWIGEGFNTYEALIKTTAGSYSIGDNPTAADCFIVPQVYNALRFELDMSQFPTIQKVHDHCIKQEAFVKSHPDNQPDTPKD